MARDKIHFAVKNALIKDGWTVSRDPFYFKSGGVELEIDMAAENIYAASKEEHEILVEVKSLDRKSLLYDFHAALGQFINYRDAMEDEFYTQELYLGISEGIYRKMKLFPFYQRRLQKHKIKLIVVNIVSQEIILWKK